MFIGSGKSGTSGCDTYNASVLIQSVGDNSIKTALSFGDIACYSKRKTDSFSGVSTSYSNTSYAGYFGCNGDANNVIGVIGDAPDSTSSKRCYGGRFKNLLVDGLMLGLRNVATSLTLRSIDSYIIMSNTSAVSIGMIANPEPGRVFYIRQNGSGITTITPNGRSFVTNTGSVISSYALVRNKLYMIVYNEYTRYWEINVTA